MDILHRILSIKCQKNRLKSLKKQCNKTALLFANEYTNVFLKININDYLTIRGIVILQRFQDVRFQKHFALRVF